MTAELVRGQNHPLPGGSWEIAVTTGAPVAAAVIVDGGPGGAGRLVHAGQPLPGLDVPTGSGTQHRLTVDAGALPPDVARVHVALSLPAGAGTFGAAAPPRVTVTTPDGAPVAAFTIPGLGPETALLAVELYRRGPAAWKLRAVGQGYATGLPALLTDHAVPTPAAPDARPLPAPHLPTSTRETSAPAPPGSPGTGAPASASGAAPGTPSSAQIGAPASGEGGTGPAPSGSARAGAPGFDDGSTGSLPLGSAQADAAADSAGADSAGASGSASAGGPTASGAAGSSWTGPSAPGGPAASGSAHVGASASGGEAAGSLAPGAAQANPSGAGGGIDYRHPRRRAAAASTPGGPQPADPGSGGGHSVSSGLPAGPVAGDAVGWSMEERLYNQVWGMFEDLARCVAAYRSADEFARQRYEQELDGLLADPRTRGGAAAEAARDAAELRMVGLVDQARAVLDRDLGQLAAEAAVVEPALPPSLAGWDNPCWHGYQVPDEPPFAVRLGELSLPEAPELRIPLMMQAPFRRGIWVDSLEDRRLALDVAVALAARLLASFPAGAVALHALDPAGSGTAALAPLRAVGALAPAPAPGAPGVTDVLQRMTDRVDLLHMARGGDADDALPPGFDTAEQVLLVNEYPYGFDDQAVQRLNFLAEEGPRVGVHLIVVGDGEDGTPPEIAFARFADPRRTMLRLTPTQSRHLGDPWVGHAWTYEPSLVPPGSQVLAQVLARVAAARPAYGP